MSNKRKPFTPTPAAEHVEATPAVAEELATPVEEVAVVEEAAPVEEKAEAVPAEPLRLGKGLTGLLKGAVNDMQFYGIISTAEAINLKERIEAKS